MPSMDRADSHLGELRDALAQMSFTLMAVLTEVAAEHDLSLTQLRVLGILRDREPTMAELATFTGLERSTISGLIDRAAARGLVRANRRPARRPLGTRRTHRVGSRAGTRDHWHHRRPDRADDRSTEQR